MPNSFRHVARSVVRADEQPVSRLTKGLQCDHLLGRLDRLRHLAIAKKDLPPAFEGAHQDPVQALAMGAHPPAVLAAEKRTSCNVVCHGGRPERVNPSSGAQVSLRIVNRLRSGFDINPGLVASVQRTMPSSVDPQECPRRTVRHAIAGEAPRVCPPIRPAKHRPRWRQQSPRAVSGDCVRWPGMPT
jgi:hypothetical protein